MTEDGWTTFESGGSAPQSPPSAPVVVEPLKPVKERDGWPWPLAIFGAIAVLLWGLTAYQAQSNYSGVVDNTDGYSAIQVSQVVDVSMAQLAPYVAAAMAATVLLFVLAVFAMLDRR